MFPWPLLLNGHTFQSVPGISAVPAPQPLGPAAVPSQQAHTSGERSTLSSLRDLRPAFWAGSLMPLSGFLKCGFSGFSVPDGQLERGWLWPEGELLFHVSGAPSVFQNTGKTLAVGLCLSGCSTLYLADIPGR